MNYRTTNVICLLLAVAGISFGVGQTVGEDRAEAGQAARVQSVKDSAVRSYLQLIFRGQLVVSGRLDRVDKQVHAACENIRLTVPSSPFRGSPPSCPDTGP